MGLKPIIDELRRRGLPVVAYGAERDKYAITFQLRDCAAKYTARIPAREATPDEFERWYRIVA